MWPLSPGARAALRTSHSIVTRLTAYTAIQGVLADLPLTGGSVEADAKSQVRRTASLDIGDPTLWPADPYAALSPIGSELAIEYGIIVPGRLEPEWVPLIRGPIQTASGKQPATGTLGIAVADRSQPIAEDRLSVPTQTVEGATCVAEISRLITETLPNAAIIDQTGSTMICPVIDIDKDRWSDGVEAIADAMAAEVYADQLGRFVIRNTPTLDDPPVWLIDASITGVLISADRELTREQTYNAVVVTGERTDGTPPVWAIVTDDDPASPTRYGGPFGRKPRFYSSPLITTTGQAIAAGQALLARVKGYVATVKVEAIPNPGLEPGDVVIVVPPAGPPQTHILDTAPCPLHPEGTQTLTTRSLDVLPAEQ